MRPPPQARCWADIDLATLERNLRRIKAGLPQGVQYVAVVKADAYGHGIQPVVSRLMQCGADMFAVANVAEGAQIREIGSGWPILVLSPVLPGEEEALLEYELIATLSTQEEAQRFNQFAKQSGSTLPVHIKIDTGMGRAGIWHEEAFTLLETVQTFEHLRLAPIHTFADAPNNSEFTKQQSVFLKTTANFRHNYSARTQPFSSTQIVVAALSPQAEIPPVNAVRVGLLQFGVYPLMSRPTLNRTSPNLSTQVGLTKKLPGTGMLRTNLHTQKGIYHRCSDCWIWRRVPAYNKAYVLINGQKCKIIGRVTMDQTIVDVTKVAQVKPDKSQPS